MQIAFLASNRNRKRFSTDPAFIYRCENLGHALRGCGHDVELGHVRGSRGKAADCVVVHRPRVSLALWHLLRRFRRSGAKLVADFDDLVFDERFARFSPAARNRNLPLWLLRKRFREHRVATRWFDHVTVSTDNLKDHVRRLFPGMAVTVLHNAVHWAWRNQGIPTPRVDRRKTVAYLPGTRSHDRDFATIAGPLEHFLHAHPEVRLRVTGPLRFRLKVPDSRIFRQDRVPFPAYARQFADLWVNLAPLESTPFNASKSALKALEAGYWGIPTICSPNADFARFASAGAVQAFDAGDWLTQLERLLDDREYAGVTARLPERTLALGDVEHQAQVFLAEVARR